MKAQIDTMSTSYIATTSKTNQIQKCHIQQNAESAETNIHLMAFSTG